jgi:hypothetical protein
MLKELMEEKNDLCSTLCPTPKNNSIEFIFSGQLCPNCGFARLAREPGNIIRCSVCGFGNGAGHT